MGCFSLAVVTKIEKLGASFLQEAFDKFMLHYQKTKQALVGAEDELGLGKESTNLLILLVHLYIFGVFLFSYFSHLVRY